MSVSFRSGARVGAVALVLAGLVGGCERRAVVPTGQLERVHEQCARAIASGSFELRQSALVGVGKRAPVGTPVVIYGASWCSACDVAREYLEMRGIAFVERDVEEDEEALAAMRRAVREAGLGRSNTLPVVDVLGTVTIGFMPCVVDAVWKT
ncbi:MAG: glutaredoxin domain-containing protein [Myxococcota bacterium]